MEKFEVRVNIATTNLESGEYLQLTIVVEADDAETATDTAARLVGRLEGGNVYGVEAEYPDGWKPT